MAGDVKLDSPKAPIDIKAPVDNCPPAGGDALGAMLQQKEAAEKAAAAKIPTDIVARDDKAAKAAKALADAKDKSVPVPNVPGVAISDSEGRSVGKEIEIIAAQIGGFLVMLVEIACGLPTWVLAGKNKDSPLNKLSHAENPKFGHASEEDNQRRASHDADAWSHETRLLALAGGLPLKTFLLADGGEHMTPRLERLIHHMQPSLSGDDLFRVTWIFERGLLNVYGDFSDDDLTFGARMFSGSNGAELAKRLHGSEDDLSAPKELRDVNESRLLILSLAPPAGHLDAATQRALAERFLTKPDSNFINRLNGALGWIATFDAPTRTALMQLWLRDSSSSTFANAVTMCRKSQKSGFDAKVAAWVKQTYGTPGVRALDKDAKTLAALVRLDSAKIDHHFDEVGEDDVMEAVVGEKNKHAELVPLLISDAPIEMRAAQLKEAIDARPALAGVYGDSLETLLAAQDATDPAERYFANGAFQLSALSEKLSNGMSVADYLRTKAGEAFMTGHGVPADLTDAELTVIRQGDHLDVGERTSVAKILMAHPKQQEWILDNASLLAKSPPATQKWLSDHYLAPDAKRTEDDVIRFWLMKDATRMQMSDADRTPLLLALAGQNCADLERVGNAIMKAKAAGSSLQEQSTIFFKTLGIINAPSN